MIKIIKIDKDNLLLYKSILEDFFNNIDDTFSYYRNRGLSHITKVCEPFLYLNEHGDLIGYGHLDIEADTIWLGIAVSKSFRGQGHGSYIVNHLIRTYKKEHKDKKLSLAVSKQNETAITLYKRHGFVYTHGSNKNWFMQLKE